MAISKHADDAAKRYEEAAWRVVSLVSAELGRKRSSRPNQERRRAAAH